jgi:hypothetical protein
MRDCRHRAACRDGTGCLVPALSGPRRARARAELANAQQSGLAEARLFYWCAAYLCISAALVLDTLRWCGCCSVLNDAVLGYRSAAVERLRMLPQAVMLVPFGHLTYLLSRPIPLPCCEGTPKLGCVMDRARVLAWLSILVSYCLFSDAHNHGYYLLRCRENAACRLLRPCLGQASDARDVEWTSKV